MQRLTADEKQAIIEKAIMHYGIDKQMKKFAEECSEVVDVYFHTNAITDKFLEEAADVLIMACQFQYLFPEEMEKWIQKKLTRLRERIS